KFAAPSFSLWGRRRVETLHRAGAGKTEIVAALEKYVNSLKEEEAITERLRQSRRGSTLLDVYDVQFRRMEAEIWLNEEKARGRAAGPAGPGPPPAPGNKWYSPAGTPADSHPVPGPRPSGPRRPPPGP